MKCVDMDVYAEQEELKTRVMIHVTGDPPVCLMEYERKFVELCGDVAAISVNGDSRCDSFIGLQITVKKESQDG